MDRYRLIGLGDVRERIFGLYGAMKKAFFLSGYVILYAFQRQTDLTDHLCMYVFIEHLG